VKDGDKHSKYDPEGRLLGIKLDGTPEIIDGTKDFLDKSDSPKLITSFGDAKLTTAQSRFGKASGYFDGSGDYLSIPNSDDWNFGQGDFTIDFWVKPQSAEQMALVDLGNGIGGEAGITVNLYGGNKIGIYSGNRNRSVDFNYAADGSAWIHFAVTRENGILRYFMNGKLVAAQENTDNLICQRAVGIGAVPDFSYPYYTKGWIDELRVSKGVSRYAGDFTPPSEAYTPDSYTKLLVHFDGKDLSSYEVVGGELKGDGGTLPIDQETLVTPFFDEVNRSLNPEAIFSADTVVSQEYSSSGALETQTKADQTVTLFNENNQPSEVLDSSGKVLIEYSYDAEGNPSRVSLKNARDTLPGEILKTRQQISDEKTKALEELLRQKNISYDSVKSQVDTQKKLLEAQYNSLQNQYNEVSGIEVHGKDAKRQRGEILNQIGHAMDDVRIALA
jgi:hypothetical protein